MVLFCRSFVWQSYIIWRKYFSMSNGQATFEATTMAFGQYEGSDEVHPMSLLLDEIDKTLLEPQGGEIRTGIIVDKRPHEILVDIGYKSEGIVSGREIERLSDSI